jgi:23S rRNA pseudouridine2605 synthase
MRCQELIQVAGLLLVALILIPAGYYFLPITVKAQHHRNPEEKTSSNQWFRCILAEGKTREVRRLWESQDVEVSRLKRISYGPIELPSFIRRSEFIELEPKQVGSLFKAVNLKPPKFNESNQLRDIRQRKEKRLRARGNPWKK